VVDASVGVKMVVEEAESDQVATLLAHLAGDTPPRFYVPDLFYVECANILWKYTRRFGYAPQEATEGLALLRHLNFVVIPLVTLVEPALPIAMQYGISAYDACYIALAEAYDVPLITADQRLVNSLAKTSFQIFNLSDFSR
jgi:predicted nucleic acid-binding protein